VPSYEKLREGASEAEVLGVKIPDLVDLEDLDAALS